MAKKLVIRNDNNEIWVIDLDPPGKVRQITDIDEHKTMSDSLRWLIPLIGVQNAIYGDDITKVETNTNHERVER